MKDNEATIHWLGAGLASVPGIRRLIIKGYKIELWERDLAKAKSAIHGLNGNAKVRDSLSDALDQHIREGDVVVSMLPATMHADIAKLCLSKGTHFVSSSYIDPEINHLNEEAEQKKLSLVNEVGLDPGIDHLLAHLLLDDYRRSAQFDPSNDHDFQSYCGGFPAIPNPFKYKFSWSPLGVLKALSSPARAIINGKEKKTEKAWTAIDPYDAVLAKKAERFESYPNRDSIPYIDHYGLDDDWNISRFVRGTLRLEGWKEAWKTIFDRIDQTPGAERQQLFEEMSAQLWSDHAYESDDYDRVVLAVELKVRRDGIVIWNKTKSLDSYGNAQSSAMARLVSIPVSLAVEAIMDGKMETGVVAAPKDPAVARQWLETIAEHGDMVNHVDHCMQANMIAAE